jgi:hypothetical protein
VRQVVDERERGGKEAPALAKRTMVAKSLVIGVITAFVVGYTLSHLLAAGPLEEAESRLVALQSVCACLFVCSLPLIDAPTDLHRS